MSLTFLLTSTPSLSNDKCEYRTGYFPLMSGQQFGGMFQTVLAPPDFRDPTSVQRHLVYSTIWARLISTELSSLTTYRCGAIIAPYPFPNLQTFLIVNDVSQLAAEKTLCSRILGEIMLNPDPTTDAVKRAGSAERFVKALQRSDPQGGAQADAANILEAALSLIYHKDSVLHALVSIYLDAYTSLDVDDFRLWLKSQQLIQRSVLIPISPCRADDKQDSANGEFQRRLNIDLPPTIKLTRSIGGPALTGNLRHLVIVGNADAPDNLQIVSRATTKYCDKRHLFPVQSGAAFDSDSSSRIGCVRETIYNLDSWIILFCNPEDCKSADKEATVMATIANDPDVRAHVLGQDISKAGARGPYQIEIESPTRN